MIENCNRIMIRIMIIIIHMIIIEIGIGIEIVIKIGIRLEVGIINGIWFGNGMRILIPIGISNGIVGYGF